MRSSAKFFGVLAAVIVAMPLAVATQTSPALAAPAAAPQAQTSAAPPVTAEGVWEPPADAASGEAPADANVPDEPWTPNDGVRLQQPEDANARGVAPLGAPVGTVAAAPGLGELPWFSFQDFALAADSSAQVNIANGNLLVKANDLTVPAPGYALRQDRFYNGLSTDPGTLGGGWRSNNGARDIGVFLGGWYVDFYGPNGLKLRFDRVGSRPNYVAPAGSNMTLTRISTDNSFALEHNQSGDRMTFSSQGWLTSTRDRNGVGVQYFYNADGTTFSALHQSGRAVQSIAAAAAGQGVAGVKDSANRTVEYTYDPSTQALKTVKSVDGKVTTYNYDSTGRLSSMVIPAAAAATTTVTFAYDSSHRVTKVTQQPGIETSFAYSGGQTIVTDSNGNTATYVIDSSGRVTSTKDALNRTRSQQWTANSDIATSTDAIGSNTTTYTYDGSNNRSGAQLPTGAAASAAYAIGAGCSAPNTGTAFQPKCSTDDAGNKKQYQYDAAGNLLKQTDTTTGTAVTEFENTYGGCGGVPGQICTTKDSNGNVTSYTYNARGDLTKVTPPAPMGATTYTHDTLGRVTSVTDGKGQTTNYQYDVRDRIVRTTFADGQTLVSSYYPNGLEQTRTDSGGGATTFEYDHQGRITKQGGPRTGITHLYTYDEVGNMLTAIDTSGTTQYTYDAANQLIKVREPGGTCPTSGTPATNSGCITFEYDQNALESKRTLPGGATTVTTRDNSGRPTRITAKTGTGASAVDIGYSYTPAGGTGDRSNIQSRTAHKEQGIATGAITSYTYDSRQRLTLAQEKNGATTTASWAYTYDNNGNRTKQVRTGATGATAGTIDYTYNAANQITNATGQTTTFTYDAAGNQTRNGLTGAISTFGDRSEQTATGSSNGTYFGTGNTDRLSQGTVTFDSSALGLIQRTNGATVHTFTRTPDGEAIGLRATNRHYYIHDHLGSVVGLFTATGTYSGGYSYSPYGEERSTSTNGAVVANTLRYIAGHHDGDGIYKLGARYYDSNLGRFTQMDPSGQESNPYAYATNNPISKKDPSGLVSYFTANLIGDLIQGAFEVAGIVIAAVIGAAHPLAAGILGILYASTGGAIGSGVRATLLDLNPSEVQAEALYGALMGVLGHFVTP